MRFFLRSDPRDDQRFTILITENSLPQFNIPQRPWHVGQLDDMVANCVAFQAGHAREAVMAHPAIQWIRNTNSKVVRFARKRHRVTFPECLSNPLTYGELMLGVSFRFTDRSHAMAFKLAWGNDASPDLIAYKPSPYARRPLALVA